jgi:hypothetical protein
VLRSTHAINAKVGEAAGPRQFAASRVGRVSAGGFLVRMVNIFELPMKFADAREAKKLTEMYGRTAGRREQQM